MARNVELIKDLVQAAIQQQSSPAKSGNDPPAAPLVSAVRFRQISTIALNVIP